MCAKQYYIQTLIDELCAFSGTTSNTYTYDNTSLDIIAELHFETNTHIWVEISEKQQDVPKLYWTPTYTNHHKNQVSSLLTRCFQCIKTKEAIYRSTIFNNSGINIMWIYQ